MLLRLVTVLATVGFVASSYEMSVDVLNQCPQPSQLNPTPSPFLYAHPDDCRYYFTCSRGKPILKRCKPQPIARYSEFYQTCVVFNSLYDTCTREHAQRECTRGFQGLIGHPTECQRYYNCSKKPGTLYYPDSGFFEDYESECPYPELFDISENKCKPYQEAFCGMSRKAAKDPCDYLNNLCKGPQCQSCQERLPSCVGLADGDQVYPRKEWSPDYIRCKSERLHNTLSCDAHKETGMQTYFSPLKRECVTPWEVPREARGLAPSCAGREPCLHQMDDRPNVYFSCPSGAVFFCETGSTFNGITQKCEPTD